MHADPGSCLQIQLESELSHPYCFLDASLLSVNTGLFLDAALQICLKAQSYSSNKMVLMVSVLENIFFHVFKDLYNCKRLTS